MDKNMIIAIVLGVLVVIAAVQAFQLFGMNNNVQTSGINTPSAASSGGAAAPSSSAGALPEMVGGC